MDNCKCFHHGVVKVLLVLAGVSALAFWWATAFNQTLFWMDADHLFKDVVILAVLAYLSKYCGCCRHGMGGGNMCAHGGSCKCGDCGMCK